MERPNTRMRPGSWTAAHPNEGDNEKWKGSPSQETTHDRGTDADVASEHEESENVPGSSDAPGARSPGARRRATRH